jgi:hypothetical protein
LASPKDNRFSDMPSYKKIRILNAVNNSFRKSPFNLSA